jgi:endonuclease V-like protein UPF0215 family
MRLHLEKPGIRVLGVAESFKPDRSWSVLGGVVMRADLVVDGLSVGRASVGGDDATASISSLFRRLGRNDVNLLMVSGCILSLYNIIDVDELARKTKLPTVCLTYKETAGIEDAIKRHFPDRAEEKLVAYRKLGKRVRVRLPSGHNVYVRTSGMSLSEVRAVLGGFTLQGSVPEPVRVARLLARAVLDIRRS